jgi:hypothetical protein
MSQINLGKFKNPHINRNDETPYGCSKADEIIALSELYNN